MATACELLKEAERLRWEKRFDAAAETLREAVRLAEIEHRHASLLLADCLSWLGVVMTLGSDQQDDAMAALGLHERALHIALDTCGEQHPSAAESLRLIGATLERLSKLTEAFDAFSKSAQIFAITGTRTRSALDVLARLSELAFRLDRFDAAAEAAHQYLALSPAEPLTEIEEMAGHMHAGRALLAGGRAAEAVPHFERNVEIAIARGRERGISEMREWLAKAKAAMDSP
jgi:tetratricopeptide (TPR) repeat protein